MTPRQQAIEYLRVNPDTSTSELCELFDFSKRTARRAKAEFNGFKFEQEIPSTARPLERLIKDRKEAFKRVSDFEHYNKIRRVRILLDGPIGIAHFGDPHVDDEGCDIQQLETDTGIVAKTEGMFAGNVGDTRNNWAGRLAHLWAQQSITATESWKLAEWFIERCPWIYFISGNHDCVSEDTEALTRDGWKKYTEITIADQVVGINPETEAAEWQGINAIIEKDFCGELNKIQTNNIDLKCTDKHRVLRRYRSNKDWGELGFVEAKDLKGRVSLPTAIQINPPEDVVSDSWLKINQSQQFDVKEKLVKEFYKGVVWCLSVPHGNFLIRRNGKPHFTGNCWGAENGDLLSWIVGQEGNFGASAVRLGLYFPNGREITINARHDFPGNSMWNPVHGPAKAAMIGYHDHILTCGHKHTSGYNIVVNPATGMLSHCIRVSSYKTFDDYAQQIGCLAKDISPCCVTIIDPDATKESKLIHVVWDLEEGADFLTWKRNRK
jgi:hypothetical protein